jgi:hypothetical protein
MTTYTGPSHPRVDLPTRGIYHRTYALCCAMVAPTIAGAYAMVISEHDEHGVHHEIADGLELEVGLIAAYTVLTGA